MKPEDTILTQEEAAVVFEVPLGAENFKGDMQDAWWALTKKGLEEQARKSFKAGIAEGKRLCTLTHFQPNWKLTAEAFAQMAKDVYQAGRESIVDKENLNYQRGFQAALELRKPS